MIALVPQTWTGTNHGFLDWYHDWLTSSLFVVPRSIMRSGFWSWRPRPARDDVASATEPTERVLRDRRLL